MTKEEMFTLLVEACMDEHNMVQQQAEDYVNKNVNNETMQLIMNQINTITLIAKNNPSIADAMLEKLKDMT